MTKLVFAKDYIASLMDRASTNHPLTEEDVETIMSYLKSEGWKHEKHLCKLTFSHKDIDKGYTIFDWPEALIRNVLLKAKVAV